MDVGKDNTSKGATRDVLCAARGNDTGLVSFATIFDDLSALLALWRTGDDTEAIALKFKLNLPLTAKT